MKNKKKNCGSSLIFSAFGRCSLKMDFFDEKSSARRSALQLQKLVFPSPYGVAFLFIIISKEIVEHIS